MNLYKINKSLNKYVTKIKDIKVPDVYECYEKLGEDFMGRKFYNFFEVQNSKKNFFNKPIGHKSCECFIGTSNPAFYQEDIVNIEYEVRELCINGNANRQDIANKIIEAFGIKDFVFDVYYKIGDEKCYLMEINELVLSTIHPQDLEFILSKIL